MEPMFLQIVDRIRESNNLSGEQAVPTSDTIYRKLLHSLSIPEPKIRFYLKALAEAHYLFAIRLVEADPKSGVDHIDGYIVAELPILIRMKDVAFKELEAAYEHQFYRRKQAAVICREIVGDARRFNNTPIGRLLNLCVMVQQYEHLMASVFHEFSDVWKRRKLADILTAEGDPEALNMKFEATPGIEEGPPDAAFPGTPTDSVRPQRAVDSAEYVKLQQMRKDGAWGEAVDKFGAQFLVRIHFRKYEFEQVKALIKQRRIAYEEDLRYVRDTIRIMEDRFHEDPQLLKYRNQMADLRRLAQLRMNELVLARRKEAEAAKF